jgi:hypothetical protein
MKAFLLSFSLFVFLISCTATRNVAYKNLTKVKEVSIFKNLDTLNWFHKGNNEKGYSGMFLDKWKREQTLKNQSKEIIVAVIDSPLEIEHDFLQNKIWINRKEIPNNGLDDDNNGYVDDIKGWNFIGTKGIWFGLILSLLDC